MVACRNAGVHIPDDLSITGVDNTDLGATQTPGLTSIRTPIVEIGHAAALQLFARLDDRSTDLTQSLPFDLVVRGSTGPPAAVRRRAR
jgi:LacI family transcriptional regulator